MRRQMNSKRIGINVAAFLLGVILTVSTAIAVVASAEPKQNPLYVHGLDKKEMIMYFDKRDKTFSFCRRQEKDDKNYQGEALGCLHLPANFVIPNLQFCVEKDLPGQKRDLYCGKQTEALKVTRI